MMFSWAIERGIIDTSPADRMRRPADEEARDRVLSDEELKQRVEGMWRAYLSPTARSSASSS